ncbi:UDP-galactose transporter senju [Condylostylus longicornis]|uniref:UDP-galactose transporter senju n=1 Tax=Condylostylus longicornis TaxID=2530218 RepID=UPI00244E5ACB|nr:UDP-galactose transporter senju [Condylostylus longicornis]
MGVIWNELFPSKLSIMIFIGYMSLFVSQGLLVTASQEKNNSYTYDTVTVVLLTEICKLLISITLYSRENSPKNLLKDIAKDLNVMMLYFVPAFLYCLYNNLAFVNLSTFDPTTYYLLLQLRVVVTGILFQIIFKKSLNQRQWLSLLLLTTGCMIKQINFSPMEEKQSSTSPHQTTQSFDDIEADHGMSSKNMRGFDLGISTLFILAQTICSCLAGVYNEYLLKDRGSEVNIFIQNVFMYLDSIICNAVILLLQGNLLNALSLNSLKSLCRITVIIIIFNNAAIGIVTSFFLKYMNSILKTFASALELVFTAILSYILFSIPIYLNTALSILIVSVAIYLYTQSPVVNLGKIKSYQVSENNVSTEKLLTDNDIDV